MATKKKNVKKYSMSRADIQEAIYTHSTELDDLRGDVEDGSICANDIVERLDAMSNQLDDLRSEITDAV